MEVRKHIFQDSSAFLTDDLLDGSSKNLRLSRQGMSSLGKLSKSKSKRNQVRIDSTTHESILYGVCEDYGKLKSRLFLTLEDSSQQCFFVEAEKQFRTNIGTFFIDTYKARSMFVQTENANGSPSSSKMHSNLLLYLKYMKDPPAGIPNRNIFVRQVHPARENVTIDTFMEERDRVWTFIETQLDLKSVSNSVSLKAGMKFILKNGVIISVFTVITAEEYATFKHTLNTSSTRGTSVSLENTWLELSKDSMPLLMTIEKCAFSSAEITTASIDVQQASSSLENVWRRVSLATIEGASVRRV